ncbi:MAG: response regulator [Alphaproteobacteria bacterium]|nr:response regulator [Alphaproteobacteria bacterium]
MNTKQTHTQIRINKHSKEKTKNSLLYAGMLVSLLLVFIGDYYTELGMVVWVLNFIPLTLALFITRPAVPLMVAVAASVFMLASYFGDTSNENLNERVALINRIMGMFSIWTAAIVASVFVNNRARITQQEWLQKGQAGISRAMLGEQNENELGQTILYFLMDYMGASVGAIYIQNKGAYECVATRGVPEDAVKKKFTANDSLLGQAVKEQRIIMVNDLPDGYITMGSAMGQSKPNNLLIAPANADGVTNTVLELGFVDDIHKDAVTLINNISESIGTAVRSANYRQNLQNFLEETQRQAEELHSQSEELRVANEELEEQSNSLQASQSQLEQQQAEMEQANSQLEEQTQMLETQRDALSEAKSSLQLRARELEQASQYKSDFLANMSHELRTPLNSTLILAKLLSDNPDENLSEEQVRYAETIYSSGNDLLTLINDILDLSKIEAGHMEIQAESVATNNIVSSLTRIFEPLAEEKKLTFKTTIDKTCPKEILTDEKRLEQVLKNLLSNAVKFTEKGTVSLKVKKSGKEHIAFEVTDSGIGIAPEQHELIFDAFKQADGNTNRKFGGTGLGLSITRELTRLLGGKISLESTMGKGSTFTITLPIEYHADNVEKRQEPQEPTRARTTRTPISNNDSAISDNATNDFDVFGPPESVASKTISDDRDQLNKSQRLILVVEDDESFARILYDLAHEMGFQCLLAHTADDALITAKQFLPDAVVLDVGLPDHSGLSVLDRLKQDSHTRHIPVHVVSGNDYAETAMSLGAVGYMMKPVKREDLMGALQKMETRFIKDMQHVLVVEDDPVQLDSMRKLLGTNNVETTGVGTAAECLKLLKTETFDCMVLDLSLPDASGYSLLETLSKEDAYSFPPVIVYTGRDLSSAEEQQLRRYSKSIIIKGAKSPERLLDEVTLFLHQVVSDLPPEQQKMLKKAKNRDNIMEGRRILVVEDDIRNVYALTSIFEPRGAMIQIARNGLEALAALDKVANDPKAVPIDLVLMDVMMPEMDGLTATLEIRKQPKWDKLPIIMLTAKAMKGDQERCIEAGANDYMSKPLDVEKLLSLVRVWMPR